MSKVEKLVKQAAVFEHLAVYSDRTSFLKRLAQTKPVDDAKIENALKSLEAGLVTWKRNFRNGTTELASVSSFTSEIYQLVDSKLPLTEEKLNDLNTAAKAVAVVPNELTDVSEKQAWFENVTKPASKLIQLIAQRTQNLAETIPPVQDELHPAINLPTQELTRSKYPTISKDLQQKLNTLLNEKDGKPIPGKTPISIDGVLGPETQAALDELNQTYYNGHFSKDQILEALKEL